jgi:V/A-type H+-transporting ATPase subunit D
MAAVKLTKNELRSQQQHLTTLQKYLPTLQLKKAMLQAEINEAERELEECEQQHSHCKDLVEQYSGLLAQNLSCDPFAAAKILKVQRHMENIAGVEVPVFDAITFVPASYSLFDTPPWIDSVVSGLRELAHSSVRVTIAQEKKVAFDRELREVSIKVNLFEKILIPRAVANIRKIKVFLGDQQLAAVSQAKAAKNKIEQQKAQTPCALT